MEVLFSVLAWRIPWTEKPGGLQSTGWQRVRQACATNTHTHLVKGLLLGSLFKAFLSRTP